MKPILLSRIHNITEFASDDPCRYVLQSVHLALKPDAKFLEATNGKILIRVPVKESEDFPPCFAADAADPQDTVIRLDSFGKALKNIPKASQPVLNTMAVTKRNGSVTLTTSDLDTTQHVESKPVEGTYPNTEQVLPTGEPKFTIGLSATELTRIVDYAHKYAADPAASIKFEFWDQYAAARLTVQVKDAFGDVVPVVCILMPTRIS